MKAVERQGVAGVKAFAQQQGRGEGCGTAGRSRPHALSRQTNRATAEAQHALLTQLVHAGVIADGAAGGGAKAG